MISSHYQTQINYDEYLRDVYVEQRLGQFLQLEDE